MAAVDDQTLSYRGRRQDIQGLRALAVILVVFFHAGIAFPGGYVGVDVFFVISGYVITQMLLREIDDTGSIDLRRFYARRTRRLLPALALVLASTLVASAILLSYGVQPVAAGTAIAATLFSANLYLYRAGGGYFDPDEELNPLLHTWSLSVEEQFYFVFPAAIALIWMLSRRIRSAPPRLVAAVVLGGMAALSLATSALLTTNKGVAGQFISEAPRFAFYSPVTRVWEFLAGALIALLPFTLARPAAAIRSAVWLAGGACIIGSALLFTDMTAFPGTAATMPVVGTVAVIVSGGSSGPSRILCTRPLVWIGDLSYSWYLWHWPAIVLARQVWPMNEVVVVAAAFASLLPAWLSYRFLEQPIRLRPPTQRRQFALVATCLTLPLALGVGIRIGAQSQWGRQGPPEWSERPQSWEQGCLVVGAPKPWPHDRCSWAAAPSDGEPLGTVFLVGDSHAAALADAVHQSAMSNGLGFMTWTREGCPFLLAPRLDEEGCDEWQHAAHDTVIDQGASIVVIVNRSPHYTLSPRGQAGMPVAREDGTIPTSHDEALGAWQAGLTRTVELLTAHDIIVVMFSPNPEFHLDGTLLASVARPNGLPQVIAVEDVWARRAGLVTLERATAQQFPDLYLVDPLPLLCDEVCSSVRDGRWLYFDDDHLSLVGASLLTETLAELFDGVMEPGLKQ